MLQSLLSQEDLPGSGGQPTGSYQVAVIGAGPAGMAAALELRRLGIDVCLISEGPPGGLVRTARRLDNIPGYPGGISGTAWAHICETQLKQPGIKIIRAKVTAISKEHATFRITTTCGTVHSRAVILAVGTKPRPLPPEITESKRVFRDLTTLPQAAAGMMIAVVGSGEAAVDMALNMRDRGADLMMCVRGESLNICTALADEINAGDLPIAYNSRILSVQDRGTCVRIRFMYHPEWVGDAVVVAIGRVSALDEIDLSALRGTDDTSTVPAMPGIFAAGDMTREHDRYVVSAMADGQRAALMAYRFVKTQEN